MARRPKPAPATPAPASPPYALAVAALLAALGLAALGVRVGLAPSPARTPRAAPTPPAPFARLPAAQLTTPRDSDASGGYDAAAK